MISVTVRVAILFALIAVPCLSFSAKRHKRQAHVEFREHFYSFKELCSQRTHLPVTSILQAEATGVPGGRYCSYFILQCMNIYGNVSRHIEQCGVGMWWSFKIGSCDIPSMAGRPECVAAVCPPGTVGPVPDPRACYGFYECEAGSAFFSMCEDTSFFNPVTNSCENSATCDRPGTKTLPNGMPACTEAQLPRACTPPGYVPSLAYCGCVHLHLER